MALALPVLGTGVTFLGSDGLCCGAAGLRVELLPGWDALSGSLTLGDDWALGRTHA